MTTSDNDLSADLVAHYRQVLVTHGPAHGAGTCTICGVARCRDWVDAYDKLAAANKVMSESPEPWEPFRARLRP
jgi:hypothetical protein